MTDTAPPTLELDGQPVAVHSGDTVLTTAQRAGRPIPHLCWHEGVSASASCRLCTVIVDGRPVAACAHPAQPGQHVQSATPALAAQRKHLLQMLLVEGNHYCPGCEKSGHCLLQEQAARAGVCEQHYQPLQPLRPVDSSHPDVWLDANRCILCQLCVHASSELDGKQIFAIGGHGIGAHLVVNSASGQLGDSALTVHDHAAHICPVGALQPKRRGFRVPLGERPFDTAEHPHDH